MNYDFSVLAALYHSDVNVYSPICKNANLLCS